MALTKRQIDAAEVPFFQIEISRALYLCRPHFDEETLQIDERRLKDLNAKIWGILETTAGNL